MTTSDRTAWALGDGEMAGRIREFDWAGTPLGPVEGWPERLKGAVEQMLASPQAVYIAWGPESISSYNDRYVSMLGARHPDALGKPFRAAWPEFWDEYRPLIAATMAGEPQMFVDQPVSLAGRAGQPVSWFTFSWTPLRDDGGRIAGFFCVATETTDDVLARAQLRESEARQGFMLRLSDALQPLADPAQVQVESCRLLAERLDVDRAYYVEVDEEAGTARVERDFVRGGAPSIAGLHRVAEFAWSVVTLRSGECHVVEDTQTSGLVPPADRPACAKLGIVACMGAPLTKDGKLVAALCVTAGRTRAWNEHEARLLREVGERTWAAVEQSRAEARLRESEARYRALATAGTYMTFRMGPDWRQMHQLDGRDIVADTPTPTENWPDEYLLPEDRPAVFAAIADAVRSKSMFELEHRIRRADGSVGWVLSRAMPMFGPEGKVVEWFGAGSDVTERRAVQEQLREKEAHLAAVFEVLPVAVGVFDVHRALLLSNGEMQRFMPTGIMPSRDEARRGRWRAWHPDGRPVEPEDFPGARALRGERIVPGIEMVYTDDNGRENWTSVSSVPLRHSGARVAGAIVVVAGIDAVKQGTEALRASEERHRLAMAAVDAMVFDWDVPSGRVVRSEGLRRLLGDGAEDAAETTDWWNERIHPDDQARLGWPAREAMAAGAPRFRALARMRHRDGHWVDVLDTGIILYGADGHPIRIVGSSVDVTERKRAEDALRDSEERLRQFGEASQDVLWMRNADTFQWTYLTPAFEAIYGLDRAAALSGDNMANWVGLILPEDRETAVANLHRVRDGERVTFEFRIRRPADGQVSWLRNTDFPIHDATGRVVRIAGVGHDVTALKKVEDALAVAEQRQRLLLEGIPQLVWRSGDDGLWTWSSPQWQDYTGQDQRQSNGWGWLDAVHPDDHEATRQAWQEAMPHGRLDVEHRVRRDGDGAWRWHATRSVPVRAAPGPGTAEGPILEWLGTTTDIEDLKRLQGQQQVMVAELQHRTRNLLAVVRNVARRSIPSSPERDEYDARLAALGRVQGFLSRSPLYTVSLADLVEAELVATGDGASEKVVVGGPAVELPGEGVQAVALALHELATNAVKYGAILQPSGRLSVTWHVEDATRAGVNGDSAGMGGDRGQGGSRNAGGRLVIDWRESGVVMPDGSPTRRGYGSELITRALPYQLKAETALEFTPDGVRCRIVLPASAFSNDKEVHP